MLEITRRGSAEYPLFRNGIRTTAFLPNATVDRSHRTFKKLFPGIRIFCLLLTPDKTGFTAIPDFIRNYM